NGSRVRFTRDVANITMDLNGVEGINFNAKGGADTITVNDLSGTDTTKVNLNLGGGDGQVDSVIVNGTSGNDAIKAQFVNNAIAVQGLAAQVAIVGSEATDHLTLNALAGDDVIDASGLPAGAISLTMNGGDGTDLLIGSQGNDLVNGGRGNDTALMG